MLPKGTGSMKYRIGNVASSAVVVIFIAFRKQARFQNMSWSRELFWRFRWKKLSRFYRDFIMIAKRELQYVMWQLFLLFTDGGELYVPDNFRLSEDMGIFNSIIPGHYHTTDDPGCSPLKHSPPNTTTTRHEPFLLQKSSKSASEAQQEHSSSTPPWSTRRPFPVQVIYLAFVGCTVLVQQLCLLCYTRDAGYWRIQLSCFPSGFIRAFWIVDPFVVTAAGVKCASTEFVCIRCLSSCFGQDAPEPAKTGRVK